jgi:FKBP-type peptidyl-prolyl cis-trans isomerase
MSTEPVLAVVEIPPNLFATILQGQNMGMTTTASGMQFEDTTLGAGAEAAAGQTCQMHYTGWLWVDNAKGKKFDSSLDRDDPFSFVLGKGQVIKGWDEGVAGMKIGGKRTLLIPSNLGYGARGAAGVIPPNATLLFEVQLLSLD